MAVQRWWRDAVRGWRMLGGQATCRMRSLRQHVLGRSDWGAHEVVWLPMLSSWM